MSRNINIESKMTVIKEGLYESIELPSQMISAKHKQTTLPKLFKNNG